MPRRGRKIHGDRSGRDTGLNAEPRVETWARGSEHPRPVFKRCAGAIYSERARVWLLLLPENGPYVASTRSRDEYELSWCPER